MFITFDPVNSISLNLFENFKANPKCGKSFTHKDAHSSMMYKSNILETSQLSNSELIK